MQSLGDGLTSGVTSCSHACLYHEAA